MKLKSALGLITLLLSSNIFAMLDASLEYELKRTKDVPYDGVIISIDCTDGSNISAINHAGSYIGKVEIQSFDSVEYKSYFYLAIKHVHDVSNIPGYVDIRDYETNIRVISYPEIDSSGIREQALFIDYKSKTAKLHKYNKNGELIQKTVCEGFTVIEDWRYKI